VVWLCHSPVAVGRQPLLWLGWPKLRFYRLAIHWTKVPSKEPLGLGRELGQQMADVAVIVGQVTHVKMPFCAAADNRPAQQVAHHRCVGQQHDQRTFCVAGQGHNFTRYGGKFSQLPPFIDQDVG